MAREIPVSLRNKLGAWNNGNGVGLADWLSLTGTYGLAVGYADLFWPEFYCYGPYILHVDRGFSGLEAWERKLGKNGRAIEAVVNHVHLADLLSPEDDDCTADKLSFLGRIMKEIYEAKLDWQFPDRPCVVKYDEPEPDGDLLDYKITFWQKSWERDFPT
ncbi:MAG: hypothetical protein AAF771_12260 [Pseudomonadota bacterium]